MAHHNYGPIYLPTFLILAGHQVVGEPAKIARAYFQPFIEVPAKSKEVEFREFAIACSRGMRHSSLRNNPLEHGRAAARRRSNSVLFSSPMGRRSLT